MSSILNGREAALLMVAAIGGLGMIGCSSAGDFDDSSSRSIASIRAISACT